MTDLNQLIAIREFCASCTIPVIAELNDKIGNEGTGAIFKVDNRLFFITASHVADLILKYPNNIGIPTGKTKSEILTFKDCVITRPRTAQDQKRYDIGLIELTKNCLLCDALSKNFNCLSISNIGPFYSRNDKYFLTGYPAVRSRLLPNMLMLSSIFMFETSTYKNKLDQNIETNPESDIFLEYSKTIITENGTEVNAPELQGISGGTIWEVDESQFAKSGIWSPEYTIKLVAIQCSYEKNYYKWVRGIKLNVLAHIFEGIDPQSGDKILEKLQQYKENNLTKVLS